MQILADASAEPSTTTNAICMENASRPQKPDALPQKDSIVSGETPVTAIPATNTTSVRIMANRNGSGSHLLIILTKKLEIALMM